MKQDQINTVAELQQWAIMESRYDYKWKPSSHLYDDEPHYLRRDGFHSMNSSVMICKSFYETITKNWKRSKYKVFIGQRSPLSILALVDSDAADAARAIVAEEKAKRDLEQENVRISNIRDSAKRLLGQIDEFMTTHAKYGSTLEELANLKEKQGPK